jgi:hypothetical protein
MKYVLTLKKIEHEVRPSKEWKKLREPFADEKERALFEDRTAGPNPQFGYVPAEQRVSLDRDVFVMEMDDVDTTKLLRAVLDVADGRSGPARIDEE